MPAETFWFTVLHPPSAQAASARAVRTGIWRVKIGIGGSIQPWSLWMMISGATVRLQLCLFVDITD
ncbi:hypothetical protein H8B02_40210 [Bradyrhizobium sp. Pear77]|nr:hypothetical protein [Bradyrhizobium altum]